MKFHGTVFILFAMAFPALAASVASYSSGVGAAAGQSGAIDPTSQGWTFTGPTSPNQYATGYDSGNGGWRTVDGTNQAPANYSQTIGGPALTALTTDPSWVMSWTIALDKDALGSAGGSVSDYYLAPNHGRQNNLVALIDLAADSIGFSITHTVDASNILVLADGSGTYNTGIDISNFPNFATFSLTYDRTGGTATLDYGAGTATLNPGAPLISGRNAIFFGAGTSGGQGSAVWNSFSVTTIPEPAAGLSGLLGMLFLLFSRRLGGWEKP